MRREVLSKPDAIRILIADDHPVVREGLESIINHQPDMKVVAVAGDGYRATELFRMQHPDLSLVDVRMPHMDGIAALMAIRKLDPAARIILLSALEGDEIIYQGLRAGAKGYLLKETPKEELLDTIRKVYSGRTCIPGDVAAKLADRVTRTELTQRELEVLRFMVVGKSNKEIGNSLNISEGTVKVHVSSLLKKLKATGRTEAINLALMRGIVTLNAQRAVKDGV